VVRNCTSLKEEVHYGTSLEKILNNSKGFMLKRGTTRGNTATTVFGKAAFVLSFPNYKDKDATKKIK
jgi:hypothetical protein